MPDAFPPLLLASAGLAATGLLSTALLRAWQDWLEVRRIEIAAGTRRRRGSSADLATLKSRVRRLEAIASGIEL